MKRVVVKKWEKWWTKVCFSARRVVEFFTEDIPSRVFLRSEEKFSHMNYIVLSEVPLISHPDYFPC